MGNSFEEDFLILEVIMEINKLFVIL